MSVYNPPLYLYTWADLPGVAGAANTYVSVFNPVTSTKVLGFVSVLVQPYSVGANTLAQSFKLYRTSAASGGTLVTAADVQMFNTNFPAASAQVRINNPTVITGALPVGSTPPPISTGLGAVAPTSVSTPGGPFLCFPGQGVAFRTDDSDVDTRWSGSIFWLEIGT